MQNISKPSFLPQRGPSPIALVLAARRFCRRLSNLGKHGLFLIDNISVALSSAEGRSGSRFILPMCRELAALSISGCRFHPRWIPTELNPADAPSRGQPAPSRIDLDALCAASQDVGATDLAERVELAALDRILLDGDYERPLEQNATKGSYVASGLREAVGPQQLEEGLGEGRSGDADADKASVSRLLGDGAACPAVGAIYAGGLGSSAPDAERLPSGGSPGSGTSSRPGG